MLSKREKANVSIVTSDVAELTNITMFPIILPQQDFRRFVFSPIVFKQLNYLFGTKKLKSDKNLESKNYCKHFNKVYVFNILYRPAGAINIGKI